MRDAFGGVFMIRLMLVFVFIFVSFTAVSLNYAKAFRVKNHVIDFIEQQEILSLDGLFRASNESRVKKLDAILDAANYNKGCKEGNGKLDREPGTPQAYCYRGIVIEQSEIVGRTIVYNVYTYAGWNLGTLNMLLAFGGDGSDPGGVDYVVDGSWEISGEARVVKRK